jgi:methyl-accepting chemotaxis protein
MQWFNNLKTGSKLALAFGVCLFLSIVVGVTAVSRMAQMNSSASLMNTDTIAGYKALLNIVDDCQHYRIYQYRYVVESDSERVGDLTPRMTDRRQKITDGLSKYGDSITQDEDRNNFEELKRRWSTYMDFDQQIKQAADRHADKDAEAILNGPSKTAFNAAVDQLETMSAWNAKRGATLADNSLQVYSSARLTLIVLLTIAVVFGVLMATFVAKLIVSNLKRVGESIDDLSGIALKNLGNAVDALAHGDLSMKVETGVKPLEVESTDEFGKLSETVNAIIARVDSTVGSFSQAQASLSKMADVADTIAQGDLTVDYAPKSDVDRLGIAISRMRASLCELIAQARSSAENIAVAAGEVSAGNQDLAQRTEEQASNLEETAASMEEMTATVKQNADNSKQANQLAAHARDAAEKGGSIVGQAVDAMTEINRSSKKIAEIISVIDEIAFQTNLLALNASVEAARVGEQGRGFAVVASEVRNLAGRSATAAKEIKSLVGDTVQKVQDGSDLVNESGTHLGEIVSAVKKVADIIGEISAASIEQSAGIEQVNKAVMQMDQMTQQNAALVEEAAGASESMAQMAGELRDVVTKFKLDDRFMQAVAQRTAMPVAQKATGTHGPTRSSRLKPAVAKPTPKLHIVSHDVHSTAEHANGRAPEEFEEF